MSTDTKQTIRAEWFITALALTALMWFASHSTALVVGVFAVFMVPLFMDIYIPYANDNPKHFWFKRKLYGWGWTPVTWQGWSLTGLYVFLITAFACTVDESSPSNEIFFTFLLPSVLLTITFIRIAYKTGEKPAWQWGDKKK